MTRSPHRLGALIVLASATLLALTACPRPQKDTGLIVPVPEGDARLYYNLTLDRSRNPGDSNAPDVIDRAVEGTVCLLRTDRAYECMEEDPDPPACTVRSREEIKAAVQPTLVAIRELTLTMSSLINREVRDHLPDTTMVVTTAVRDARRTSPCYDWSSDGACVAVRVDKAWILLHAPPDGGQVDSLWVFVAERVCDERPEP